MPCLSLGFNPGEPSAPARELMIHVDKTDSPWDLGLPSGREGVNVSASHTFGSSSHPHTHELAGCSERAARRLAPDFSGGLCRIAHRGLVDRPPARTGSAGIWHAHAAWPLAVRLAGGDGSALSNLRDDDFVRLVRAGGTGTILAGQPRRELAGPNLPGDRPVAPGRLGPGASHPV